MPQLDYGTHGHQGLSYSRRSTFHSCPRKFQIEQALGLAKRTDSVTFAFGHAVAAGVQEYFRSRNKQLAMIQVAVNYSMPWDNLGTGSEQRGKKSIWTALASFERYLQVFESKLPNELTELQDYEIAEVEVNGEMIPAIELQFRILLDNGFVYEGHIDLILRSRTTGEYVIIELKTTVFRDPHDALYQNSEQALSYSIVLDKMVGASAKASYSVYYMIYSSSKADWILKKFRKEAKRRFDWINNLIRECELIAYYQQGAEAGIPYPTNGANCYEFFSACGYISTCHMEDSSLTMMYGSRDKEEAQFKLEDNTHFVFTIQELIDSQVALTSERDGVDLINVVEEVT